MQINDNRANAPVQEEACGCGKTDSTVQNTAASPGIGNIQGDAAGNKQFQGYVVYGSPAPGQMQGRLYAWTDPQGYPVSGPVPGYNPGPVPGQMWAAGPQIMPGYASPDQMAQGGASEFPGHTSEGDCDCKDHPQGQGHGAPHSSFNPKHELWRYGQLVDVVNGIATGKPDVEKIMGIMEEYDGQFWKGLLIGAAGALIVTNDTVKDAILGAFGATWDLFRKEPSEGAPPAETSAPEKKTEQGG